MRERVSVARVLAVVVLAIAMIGWGVRSLVHRTVEVSSTSTSSTSSSTAPSPSLSTAPTPAPSPSTATSHAPAPSPAPAAAPAAAPSPSPAPSPSSAPSPADLDDPLRTPLVPSAPPDLHVVDPTEPIPHRGSLPPMVVRDVVRDAMPELRFCFEWQLNQHPELAGRMTMEFTIAADGTVEEPHLFDDRLGDETVTRCFTHVISHLHFPPPDGEGSVLVRYPFILDGAPEARRPEGI